MDSSKVNTLSFKLYEKVGALLVTTTGFVVVVSGLGWSPSSSTPSSSPPSSLPSSSPPSAGYY
jgi:hypothetical protein